MDTAAGKVALAKLVMAIRDGTDQDDEFWELFKAAVAVAHSEAQEQTLEEFKRGADLRDFP